MDHLRYVLAIMAVATGITIAGAAAAEDSTQAAQSPPPLQGIWLTTDFPGVTEHIGDKISVELSVRNKGLPPARLDLGVTGLPSGWTYEFDGGGKPVTTTIVGADSSQSFALNITPPKDAKAGDYRFDVTGKSATDSLDLPIALVLAEAKPDKVSVEPKLPALRGSPSSSFDFDLDIKNQGAEDQTFNLVADAPPGFTSSFKDQYGTQELTSLPIKAGESHTVKLTVKPPENIAAGEYHVAAEVAGPASQGKAELVLGITGQPKLALAGPDGRLSGAATAGKERSFDFSLHNSGSAPAKTIKFDAAPPSGWKVTFDPKQIETLGPGQDATVHVAIQPADDAIAGDYVLNVSANGDGASDSQTFRVTVLTSTLWGTAGLGIIAAAVVVLAVAVTRYGRR
jgi:uncharacterized membrane protein